MHDNKNEVVIKDERYSKVRDMLEKQQTIAFEFAQTRSSFQIEKFIGCDEHTPVTKFRHLSHNCYVMVGALKDILLDMEVTRRSLDKMKRIYHEHKLLKLLHSILNPKRYENLDITIYRTECSLTEMEIRVKGLLQEIHIFDKLCEELEKKNGKPFTYEDFEKDQPNYWRVRLASQMHERQIGNALGFGEGNYESLLQAMQDPILPGSHNKIANLDLSQIAILEAAMSDRKDLEFVRKRLTSPGNLNK